MPELPEVETIRRQLSQELIGAEISGVEIRAEGIFVGDPQLVMGQKITKVTRVGKYLFVHFESGRGLAIHLKMTGRLIIRPLDHKTIKPLEMDYETAIHTRVVIDLKDGRKIYYWDTRKFGYVKVVGSWQLAVDNLKQKMGPEPWDLSDTDLLGKLQKTGRSIKDAILDQSLLAGVGNIYANDGLWLARLNPKRRANSLSLTEVAKLRKSLVSVLERGLATGGASDNSYVDAHGKRGTYQNEFLVYRRVSEPCHNCGLALKRMVISGRGTWVCETCQR